MRFSLLYLPLLTLLAFATRPALAQGRDVLAGLGQGAGDLMLIPTRVVLEGRQRAAEVMLKNQGKEIATYRIFLKEMEMGPDGQLVDHIKGAGEISAADLVRFTPKQVDLAPGEAQTVRIQVRKPENLPDGEYRSHMVFQGVPPADPPQPPGSEEDKSLTITIRPVYGISIPLIVRHGETRAVMTMSDLKYLPPQQGSDFPGIGLLLGREGNRSVLGDFEVTVDSGTTLKKGAVISQIKGLAVYHNIPSREIKLPLFERIQALKGGRLKIAYTSKDYKAPVQVAYVDIP
jgi:P pilus assembly chaperone PapD